MSVNIQQVENLNKKAQFLNGERQKQIGMKESARSAYDKAVFAYQQKYGVQLDDSNLQSEYNMVAQKTTQEFEELNKLVLSIESGEYKQKAQGTATPTQPVTNAPFQANFGTQPVTQQPVTQQSQVQPPTQPTNVQPVTQQPTQTQVAQQQVAVAVEENQPPKSANLGADALAQAMLGAQNQPTPNNPFNQQPTQQTQPTQSQPSNGGKDISEESFTPKGWGQTGGNLDQNFANILGGGSAVPGAQKFGQ